MAVDNTTATFQALQPGVEILRSLAVRQMASAYPLPSTVTFANAGSNYVPVMTPSFVATI
jgi:hypothetical protein